MRFGLTLIARFMGPTCGPSGADRAQVGPMLAPWTLLSGDISQSPLPSFWRNIKIYLYFLSHLEADISYIICDMAAVDTKSQGTVQGMNEHGIALATVNISAWSANESSKFVRTQMLKYRENSELAWYARTAQIKRPFAHYSGNISSRQFQVEWFHVIVLFNFELDSFITDSPCWNEISLATCSIIQ